MQPPTHTRRRQSSDPVPFTLWDRDRGHQDRLGKRIARLRQTGPASSRRSVPRVARAGS